MKYVQKEYFNNELLIEEAVRKNPEIMIWLQTECYEYNWSVSIREALQKEGLLDEYGYPIKYKEFEEYNYELLEIFVSSLIKSHNDGDDQGVIFVHKYGDYMTLDEFMKYSTNPYCEGYLYNDERNVIAVQYQFDYCYSCDSIIYQGDEEYWAVSGSGCDCCLDNNPWS